MRVRLEVPRTGVLLITCEATMNLKEKGVLLNVPKVCLV